MFLQHFDVCVDQHDVVCVWQAALACTMLAEGGSLPAGEPVPQANPKQFAEWIIDGYNSAGEGTLSVDR